MRAQSGERNMGRVLVVGSSNVDLTIKTARLPQPGETVSGGSFSESFGGKGGNVAVAAARAGAEVELVGALGGDDRAAGLRRHYGIEGVGVRWLAELAGAATGTAFIIVDAGGNNQIAVAPGANHRFGADHIASARGGFDWCDTVVLQNEMSPEAVEAVLRCGRAAGKTVVYNAAPARNVADDLLRCASVIVVNEREAEFLSGRAVSDAESAAAAGRLITARAECDVLVTLGKNGAVGMSGGEVKAVAPFAVNAVDSTGAGDVCCGYLAAELSMGSAFFRATEIACAAAALSVTAVGAQTGTPRRRDVLALLASAGRA